MRNFFIIVFLGASLLSISAGQPVAPDPSPAGHQDYDLGGGEELFVEETTTARPARRRLAGSRAKPKPESDISTDIGATTTTATTTTEKPARRTRTTTSSSISSDATPKSPEAIEQSTGSTYRRPKFPPRRLPTLNRKKTTTAAPLEELTSDPLYPDGPAAEGPVGQDGLPAEAPIDEVVSEGAR